MKRRARSLLLHIPQGSNPKQPPFSLPFPAPSPRRRLGARVSPDCPPISLQFARTAAGFDAEVIR